MVTVLGFVWIVTRWRLQWPMCVDHNTRKCTIIQDSEVQEVVLCWVCKYSEDHTLKNRIICTGCPGCWGRKGRLWLKDKKIYTLKFHGRLFWQTKEVIRYNFQVSEMERTGSQHNSSNHTDFYQEKAKYLQFVPDYIHSHFIIKFVQMSVSYSLSTPGTAMHCRLWKPRISRVYEPKVHNSITCFTRSTPWKQLYMSYITMRF